MTTTISYNLQPIPKWYFVDMSGKPLSSGYMLTWSSLNPTQPKIVYQDIGGTIAYPQRIDIDLNGTRGPFYWKFDSSVPNDLYFIQVFDVNNNLQWTINDYGGDVGGGGGGGGTTYVNLRNYVVNNVYQSNIGASSQPLPAVLKLAPGTHEGFVSGANVGGSTDGDITFSKNNTASTDDQITFTQFPQGTNPLTGDVTPIYYLNFTGTAGAAETYKYVQYPLVSKVQNLSNTQVTFTLWARCNSGGNVVQLYLRQFYGDGAGASLENRLLIGSLNLTSAWTFYNVTVTTPNCNGKTLGGCHNDGLYLQFQYPLTGATNIDHTKPCMYIGPLFPSSSFDIPDEIDAVVDTPRTGDVRTSINDFYPLGWLPMTDQTIGNPSSNASLRQNFDTFPLFNLLWNINTAYVPLFDSAGNPVARGASAVADYTANTQIRLTLAQGRVLGGTGLGSGLSNRVIGEFVGEESVTLVAGQIPNHTHDAPSGSNNYYVDTTNAAHNYQGDPGGAPADPVPRTGNVTGTTGQSHDNMQPTTFMNLYIKL